MYHHLIEWNVIVKQVIVGAVKRNICYRRNVRQSICVALLSYNGNTRVVKLLITRSEYPYRILSEYMLLAINVSSAKVAVKCFGGLIKGNMINSLRVKGTHQLVE